MAAAPVAAPPQQCMDLLQAVDAYPAWHPDLVRSVTVLERDDQGRPTQARATLRVAVGPFTKEVVLVLAVHRDGPRTVKLTRLRNEPADEERFEARWRVHEGGQTRIELELEADFEVPRLIRVGAIGDAMARDFVTAASAAIARPRGDSTPPRR
ncbi:MAG: SRPBCC family protein [Solirubrobacteraceae bacterium]